MAKQFSKSGWQQLLWRSLLQVRQSRSQGFTLIELLVSMVIATLIVGGLLYAVVEITSANQRESARTETQRDMQAAIDYITADLREAVFVYDSQCMSATGVGSSSTPDSPFCPGLLNTTTPVLPTNLINDTTGNLIPVLAFWRVDQLPSALVQACATYSPSASATSSPMNNVPCVSRRSYTLIMYLLDKTPSSNWRGVSRITRYQLAQYPDSGGSPLGTTVSGYVSPLVTNSFVRWPYQGSTNLMPTGQPGASWVTAPVTLTDFVDDGSTTTPSCPSDMLISTPKSNVGSFYACVRNGGVNSAATPQNQEVLVYLRGSVAGRPGFQLTNRINTAASLPTLETRVLIRGITNKVPSD